MRTKPLTPPSRWSLQSHHMEDCRGQVSQTVPHEAYSIQELFRKAASNMLPPVGKDGVYMGGKHDDYDVEKLMSEDPVDKLEAADDMAHRNRLRKTEIDQVELKLKADSAAKAQADEEALLAKLQSRLTGAQQDASK